MSSDIWRRPIEEQVDAERDGSATADSLVQQVRTRIVDRESDLEAWVVLSDDLDDQTASTADGGHALPLRGISLGVKDLIDVAGIPTRAGSSVTSADPVATDAACVRRFRELGAVVQGKTVTTEFGYFAPGPTRNPHAPDHTPGGSSSGSAAAVGAGILPIALGTQTAGSLTRPASYCGAAGLVLTQGSTSLEGVTGLSESLDSLGMLARSTADLHYVYSSFVTGHPEKVARGPVSKALIWHGSELGELDPAMQSLLDRLPAILDEADIEAGVLDWDDHVRTLADDHVIVMSYEAAETLHDIYEIHRDSLSEPLRKLVVDGRSTSKDDYAAALIRRDRSRAILDSKLGDDTVVIGPAALGPAPRGLAATGSPVLSRPWQLLGSPALAVPGARTDDGLPLGLQMIGPRGTEIALLGAGVALEAALAPVFMLNS